MNLETHWNNIFEKTKNEKLGWWESDASQTLNFIKDLSVNPNTNIFLAGAGTSILVDELVKIKCNLILNDISKIALEKVKNKLLNKQNTKFFKYDLSKPFTNKDIDIWIDRAVLHFLIKEEDIKIYFGNLKNNLKIGGFVLLAQFRVGGATSCASLPINQYSLNKFSEKLGDEFKLMKSKEVDFVNPNGDKKEYIYALFQKIA